MIVELTVMATVLFGLIGLTIDGSRWMWLRTQLAFTANSAASAGAKQLDQSAGSIHRAKDAANAIAAANFATFDGLTTAAVTSVRVCASLPCGETSADDQARYIEIAIDGQTERVFFTPVELRASARAIGG